jgi:hypothetical protein
LDHLRASRPIRPRLATPHPNPLPQLSITHNSQETLGWNPAVDFRYDPVQEYGITHLENGRSPLNAHSLWAARLSAATTLPDGRLNIRLGIILEHFASRPTDSIPQAAGDWGQAKAVYRFLDNDRVIEGDLRAGVALDTARLCQGQEVILAVQDTTALNLAANGAIDELGPTGPGGSGRGLFAHTTLAVTVAGAVVGVLGQQFWVRPRKGAPGPGEKESAKWVVGIDQARQALYGAGDQPPRLIHVMDREGDAYEVMQWIDDAGDSAIIRCAQDRLVDGPVRAAHEAVRAEPALGRSWLTVPRSHGRTARDALVEVRALSVTLTPDREKYPHAWAMTWTLVEVREPDPPPGVEAVHWRLWTREPAATAAEAWEVARKYTRRWPIEEFHLTLKSGCRIEGLRLETWGRLAKALVLYSAVAARVVSLRDLSGGDPDAPATVLLSEEECAILTARCGRGKPSPYLTMKQAVLWIGRLGGHLNRKGDGMPGVRTLWRGLRDLGLLVEGYRVAKRLIE